MTADMLEKLKVETREKIMRVLFLHERAFDPRPGQIDAILLAAFAEVMRSDAEYLVARRFHTSAGPVRALRARADALSPKEKT